MQGLKSEFSKKISGVIPGPTGSPPLAVWVRWTPTARGSQHRARCWDPNLGPFQLFSRGCAPVHSRVSNRNRNCVAYLLSLKSAGHMQNRKTKTNTNPSPDHNRYRSRCPDPNATIQKFIHYMTIATFAIADCHHHSILHSTTIVLFHDSIIPCLKLYRFRFGAIGTRLATPVSRVGSSDKINDDRPWSCGLVSASNCPIIRFLPAIVANLQLHRI